MEEKCGECEEAYRDFNDPDGWHVSNLRKILLLRFRNPFPKSQRRQRRNMKQELFNTKWKWVDRTIPQPGSEHTTPSKGSQPTASWLRPWVRRLRWRSCCSVSLWVEVSSSDSSVFWQSLDVCLSTHRGGHLFYMPLIFPRVSLRVTSVAHRERSDRLLAQSDRSIDYPTLTP